MGNFAHLWKLLTRWYISSLFFAAVGVLLGYVLFSYVFPGKPQIGMIDIPFTIIDDDAAFEIGQMLDFARRSRSIKAVVIRLESPGGSAAASENVFLKTLKLREKKPVVISAQGLAASGAYLMSMGANYIYASPTSFVGNVGVILRLSPPERPSEREIPSGPAKLTGGSDRTYIRILEMVKEAFIQTVVTQRGERLKLTPLELAEGRIYPGMEAVRLGLVDGIGSEPDAIEKAASLAGISRYELVDVNVEVLRLFVQKSRRVFGYSKQEGLPQNVNDIRSLRRLLTSANSSDRSHRIPPGFPNVVNLPQIYYLYVPPSE